MTSKKKNTFESNAVQNRFTAYLITAIHRKKVDYWKKAEYVRAHELMVGTDEMFEDGEASYENVMNIGEGVRYEVLDDALKQLSVRERYVIFARVVDMRGFAEIGTKLGLGYQGAAAVYYRAIRKIKKLIVESEKGGRSISVKFGTLLLLAQEGDEQAKEKILRLYRPLLFREAKINGIFDEDLYQELCVTLLQCICRFVS